MLTIFSIPKPFKGHIGTIQWNAIKSWTLLQPRPEIMLFGEEEGTAKVAAEFGVRHFPEIASNQYGTPVLNDLFRRAEQNAGFRWMCYVNADIILLGGFAHSVARVTSKLDPVLLVSERINLDIDSALSFDSNWEDSLKRSIRESGKRAEHVFIDAFVFPKGLYSRIPEFAIGRCWFDHWLIKAARENKVPVLDLSEAAPLVHQNHDYNHVPGGANWVWNGAEAENNRKLFDGVSASYTLLEATHRLTATGEIRRVWLRRRWFETRRGLWRLLVHDTVGMRDRLRLRRRYWQKGPHAHA